MVWPGQIQAIVWSAPFDDVNVMEQPPSAPLRSQALDDQLSGPQLATRAPSTAAAEPR
jgi:hypothetical protein